MCKRLAFAAEPTDVSGDHFRDACRTGAIPGDAPPTLVALLSERARLVAALDSAVPADFTGTLQTYLASNGVLGLYDDGTMATSVASIASVLEELAQDDALVATFARQGSRDAYRPSATASGALAAITATPSLDGVLLATLPAITPGGVSRGEWDSLVAAVSATLADASAPPDAAAPDRTAALAVQLLLTERADLGDAQPLLLVRRDARGFARPAAMTAPFVDANSDGLADVDALGRFVDASGNALDVEPPYAGATPSPLYAHVDVSKTLAGALARDVSPLFDPIKGTALDLTRGASALLGPRVMATKLFDSGATLAYRGYDTTQSPLLDMAYGYMQLLRDPNVRDLLALADELFANRQPATARLIEAAIRAARVADASALIDPTSPLFDDLVPVLRQILARPALVRALLQAMGRPEVKQLATRFAEYMTYSDRFDINASTQAVVGSFAMQPNRTAPDNLFNRSLWQRLLHLINDSNGAVACNKQGAVLRDPVFGAPIATYNQCELFRVNNLAVFYVQAIAYAKDTSGRYICEDADGDFNATQTATTPQGCSGIGTGWRPRPKADFNYNFGSFVSGTIDGLGGDQFIEDESGITGMRTHPTPQALNRVLFLDPMPAFLADVIEPMRDRDGDQFRVQHVGTLPVWERNNFYDQIRPLVQAFADHNSEQLFVDLLSVMHKHWPSKDSITTQRANPAGPNYAWAANVRSYEPLLVEVMKQDLVPALVDTASELDAITANGKPYATIVTNAASFLVTPLPGLTDRQGRATTTTADGKPVAMLSPWHVLADAYIAKRDRIAAVATEGQAWTDSVSEVVDVLFRGAQGTAGWGFSNGHVAPVTRALIAFTRARLDAHDQAGDRTAWLSQQLPKRTEDTLAHPVFAGIADVTTSMSADVPARVAVDTLLRDAFDPIKQPQSFAQLRTAMADLIQLGADDADLVPIARAAGRLLAPDKPYLATQLDFVMKLRAGDEAGGTLVTLLGQTFDAFDDSGVPAIAAITDAVGEVDRVAPGSDYGTAWTAADYASVLRGVAGFLREQQRGLPRFIAIVAGRNP